MTDSLWPNMLMCAAGIVPAVLTKSISNLSTSWSLCSITSATLTIISSKVTAFEVLQNNDGLHRVPCLLSGASIQAGDVSVGAADGPGDNWFGPEQFSSCMVIVFVACMSPRPGRPHFQHFDLIAKLFEHCCKFHRLLLCHCFGQVMWPQMFLSTLLIALRCQ